MRLGYISENVTLPTKRNLINKLKYRYTERNSFNITLITIFHFIMFVSGATLVIIINKKNVILQHIQNIIKNLKFEKNKIYLINYLNNIDVIPLYQYTQHIYKHCIELIRILLIRFKNLINNTIEAIDFPGSTIIEEHEIECEILIGKIKEINEDKKNLGQLLVSAVEENKTLRMKFQLEKMAKERLLKHVDDTNKQIKDNRSRYLSFQNLYLVTHQENIFLKARIRKITKEKTDVENNLIKLLQKVYETKNPELLTYCSRFIVQTKNNFMNSDVTAEINTFLRKPKLPRVDTTYWSSDFDNIRSEFVVTEVTCENKFSGKSADVSTIEDKRFDSNLNKIYTVCLSESAQKSKTKTNTNFIQYKNNVSGGATNFKTLKNPLTNANFLTGSAAFQNFMKYNTIPSISSTEKLQLCG